MVESNQKKKSFQKKYCKKSVGGKNVQFSVTNRKSTILVRFRSGNLINVTT